MTSSTNTYRVYGLRISSPVQLPGLQQTSEDPDVIIEYESLDSEIDAGSISEGVTLSYDGIGAFNIRNGRHVAIDPVDGIGDTALQPYLIGPIIGVILYQRGYLVLHGSSVSIGDTAVIFLGSSGAGKSTIAAACQVRGNQVLSDDITAVAIVDEEPVVIPGLPYLKLKPELSDSLNFGQEYISPAPGDKALYRIPSGTPESPQSLGRLYLLTDGDLRSEKMDPGETIQALVGHTYTQSLLEEESIGNHFRQCIRVAEATEIHRLSRPRKLALLSDTIRQVEQEVT